MRRVLVTHPGRQHSHRAALALQVLGRLRSERVTLLLQNSFGFERRRQPPALLVAMNFADAAKRL